MLRRVLRAGVAGLSVMLAAQTHAATIIYQIDLDAAQSFPVPNVNGFNPTGTATVTLNTTVGLVSVTGSYSGMTSNVSGSHLHGPAGPGATAGVFVPLSNTGGTSGSFSVVNGGLTPQNVQDILNGLSYINIHTVQNALSEIRGQVPMLPDLSGDGFVGIADLNIVLGTWNQNVTLGDRASGDPSGDGFVGLEDLNIVLGNWNAGTPPVGSAVPEPGTFVMLGLAGAALLGRHRSARWA